MEKRKLLTLLCSMFLVLVLGALLFVGACRAPAPKVEPVRIGVILPMTGSLADAGPKAKQGIELRFAEAGWEVAGRPIQLIYEDDGSEDTGGLEKAKKLVESDKVHMLIGGILLEFCIPYTAEVKVPQIGLRPIIPRTGMVLTYDFMPDGTFKMFDYPMAWYAYDKLGYKTATCIAHDMNDGRETITNFTDAFQAKGGTVVQEQFSPMMTADYGPYLVALKQAAVTMAWMYPPEIAAFLKQYNEFGLFKKQPVIIPLCEVLMQEMMPDLGDYILGIKGSCDYHWPIDTSVNKKFVAGIKEKYGETTMVDSYTLGGYEAASIALVALKATGGDTTSEKLRQAILGVNIETPSTKSLTFRPDGWGSKDMHIFDLQKIDGQYAWEPIYTYPAVDPIKPVAP